MAYTSPQPHATPKATWTLAGDYEYQDATGKRLFLVQRWRLPNGKKAFSQCLPDGPGKWRKPAYKGETEHYWCLYRLPELTHADPATPIVLVEGEKDVQTVERLGYLATTSPAGAKNWQDRYVGPLAGRTIIILPDNDADGARYCHDAGADLLAAGCTVKVCRLPGLPEKGDVSDWLQDGHATEDLRDELDRAVPWALDSQAHQDATQRRNSHNAQPKSLIVTQLSTVTPERVEFLWKPFLPKGRPVALEGDPGVGKSALVAKIIAHITTGTRFPNVLEKTPPPKDFTPQNVCLLTSEDDPADTLVPRIVVNGGNVSRVYYITGWEQPDGVQGIVTLQDLELLKTAMERYTPAVLVFDPIQSFFGRGVDMNHANETRPVLDAVAALCKAHDCTPLYVRHLGKARREKAIHASLGSIDITGNMRSVLFLATDPGNKERRILAHSKVNNAPLGQSLAYTVRSVVADIPAPDGGMVTTETPRLDWDGLSTLTADDLACPPLPDEAEKPALEQAREFLEVLLTEGPVLYTDVQRAAKQAGISLGTLKRAKPLLGVKSRRRPEDGTPSKDWPWEWFLEAPRGSSPDAYADDTLEPLEKVPIKSSGCEETSRDSHEPIEVEAQRK